MGGGAVVVCFVVVDGVVTMAGAVVVVETVVWVVVGVVDFSVGFSTSGFDVVFIVVDADVVTFTVLGEGEAVENGFGINDSTTPTGPSRSISDSGQVNSSGNIE